METKVHNFVDSKVLHQIMIRYPDTLIRKGLAMHRIQPILTSFPKFSPQDGSQRIVKAHPFHFLVVIQPMLGVGAVVLPKAARKINQFSHQCLKVA
jgi:hypothetical protein